MAPTELSVVAILYPKKGKADEVVSLLQDVAQYTKSKELDVVRYEVTRSIRPAKDGTEEIVMIERYKNQQTLKEHGSSEKFTSFQKELGAKGLLRAPMTLKMVSQVGGFSSRL